MSFCDNCFKTVRHEGSPLGRIERINGVETYIAIPEGEYAKDKAILFLPDVFGMQYVNNKLLADDFARNGLATYIPDYLNGDPVTEEMISSKDFQIAEWFRNHGNDKTRPSLDAVIKGLQERGISTFGATAYCFGAPYLFDLALKKIVKVSVTAHPSRLQVPKDLEHYAANCTAPLLINSCEVDGQFPVESQAIADQIFGDGKFKPGYQRNYYEGCQHGFAVRGDMTNPKVRSGKEGAFKASVEWFQKYLLQRSVL